MLYKQSSIDPDPDTELLRRMEFEYEAYQLLKTATSDTPVSLFLVSYDLETIPVEEKLKLRFGHDMKNIAKSIKTRSHDNQVIGRLGKKDIAIIASIDEKKSETYAHELCHGIKSDFKDESAGINKTVSIGIITTTSFIEIESAINEAERCMIAAKAMGHDQICTTKQLFNLSTKTGIPLNLLTLEYKIRVEAEETASDVAFQTRRTILDYIHKSETDPLTGLNNRGYLDNRLKREIEIAHKQKNPLCFAIIDADHFGKVNTQYNHATGDTALRVLSDVIRQEIRPTDWVARYGGEEFCVVMPSTSYENGMLVLERIRTALHDQSIPTNKGDTFKLSISSGVIECDIVETKIEQLYARASEVEKLAKNQGRNRTAGQKYIDDAISILPSFE